jgi:hypothetical protein
MPAENKISIYAGPAVQALLADRRPGDRSRALNTVVERYVEVVRRTMPALSLAQWCAVIDCLYGATLDTIGLRGIAMSLADEPELAEKWNIDLVALVQRVQAMSFAEVVGLAEVVERFLEVDDRPTEHMRTRLEAFGARIAD